MADLVLTGMGGGATGGAWTPQTGGGYGTTFCKIVFGKVVLKAVYTRFLTNLFQILHLLNCFILI